MYKLLQTSCLQLEMYTLLREQLLLLVLRLRLRYNLFDEIYLHNGIDSIIGWPNSLHKIYANTAHSKYEFHNLLDPGGMLR